MATFPTLKTGGVAQYPLAYSTRFSTQDVQFLDGSRQRYQISGRPLRRWQVRLNLLDEIELASVIAFADAQGPDLFAFPDPVSGTTVPNCALSGDSVEAILERDLRGQVSLTIEEVR